MSWKGSTTSIEDLTAGWPGDHSIAALAFEPSESARVVGVADRVARALAVHRDHILLADVSGQGVLDAALGGAEGPGLPGALSGVARLTDIAVQREGQPYVFLPAGDAGSAPAALLETEAFRSFAARVRERGGTLLLLLPADALGSRPVRDVLDGYVMLGGGKLAGYPEPPCHGVVALDAEWLPPPPVVDATPAEPPTGAPGDTPGVEIEARDGDAGTTPELWRRHRSPGRLPVRKVLLGVAVMVILLTGWWAFAAGVGTPEESDGATMSAPASGPPGAAETPAAPPGEAELEAALARTGPLSHSVLVASHTRRADAIEHLLALRQAGHAGLFMAPTPLRTRTYYRVFEGAYPSRAAALEAMPRLLEAGVKEEASDWDARPARQAFRVGVFGTRGEADAAMAELGDLDAMAYVVATPWPRPAAAPGSAAPATSSPDSVWAMYLGAFETAAAARLLAEELEQASIDAPQLERLGAPPTSDESRRD